MILLNLKIIWIAFLCLGVKMKQIKGIEVQGTTICTEKKRTHPKYSTCGQYETSVKGNKAYNEMQGTPSKITTFNQYKTTDEGTTRYTEVKKTRRKICLSEQHEMFTKGLATYTDVKRTRPKISASGQYTTTLHNTTACTKEKETRPRGTTSRQCTTSKKSITTHEVRGTCPGISSGVQGTTTSIELKQSRSHHRRSTSGHRDASTKNTSTATIVKQTSPGSFLSSKIPNRFTQAKRTDTNSSKSGQYRTFTIGLPTYAAIKRKSSTSSQFDTSARSTTTDTEVKGTSPRNFQTGQHKTALEDNKIYLKISEFSPENTKRGKYETSTECTTTSTEGTTTCNELSRVTPISFSSSHCESTAESSGTFESIVNSQHNTTVNNAKAFTKGLKHMLKTTAKDTKPYSKSMKNIKTDEISRTTPGRLTRGKCRTTRSDTSSQFETTSEGTKIYIEFTGTTPENTESVPCDTSTEDTTTSTIIKGTCPRNSRSAKYETTSDSSSQSFRSVTSSQFNLLKTFAKGTKPLAKGRKHVVELHGTNLGRLTSGQYLITDPSDHYEMNFEDTKELTKSLKHLLKAIVEGRKHKTNAEVRGTTPRRPAGDKYLVTESDTSSQFQTNAEGRKIYVEFTETTPENTESGHNKTSTEDDTVYTEPKRTRPRSSTSRQYETTPEGTKINVEFTGMSENYKNSQDETTTEDTPTFTDVRQTRRRNSTSGKPESSGQSFEVLAGIQSKKTHESLKHLLAATAEATKPYVKNMKEEATAEIAEKTVENFPRTRSEKSIQFKTTTESSKPYAAEGNTIYVEFNGITPESLERSQNQRSAEGTATSTEVKETRRSSSTSVQSEADRSITFSQYKTPAESTQETTVSERIQIPFENIESSSTSIDTTAESTKRYAEGRGKTPRSSTSVQSEAVRSVTFSLHKIPAESVNETVFTSDKTTTESTQKTTTTTSKKTTTESTQKTTLSESIKSSSSSVDITVESTMHYTEGRRKTLKSSTSGQSEDDRSATSSHSKIPAESTNETVFTDAKAAPESTQETTVSENGEIFSKSIESSSTSIDSLTETTRQNAEARGKTPKSSIYNLQESEAIRGFSVSPYKTPAESIESFSKSDKVSESIKALRKSTKLSGNGNKKLFLKNAKKPRTHIGCNETVSESIEIPRQSTEETFSISVGTIAERVETPSESIETPAKSIETVTSSFSERTKRSDDCNLLADLESRKNEKAKTAIQNLQYYPFSFLPAKIAELLKTIFQFDEPTEMKEHSRQSCADEIYNKTIPGKVTQVDHLTTLANNGPTKSSRSTTHEHKKKPARAVAASMTATQSKDLKHQNIQSSYKKNLQNRERMKQISKYQGKF